MSSWNDGFTCCLCSPPLPPPSRRLGERREYYFGTQGNPAIATSRCVARWRPRFDSWVRDERPLVQAPARRLCTGTLTTRRRPGRRHPSALLASFSIVAVLLTLLLLLNLCPSSRRATACRREGGRGREPRRPAGFLVAGHFSALPATAATCADPPVSSLSDHVDDGHDRAPSRLLLDGRPDVTDDDQGFELDEAMWPRPNDERVLVEVLHWHGSNMLNTSWGWMA